MNNQSILKFIAGDQPILNVNHAILSAPVRHIFMIAIVWYIHQQIKNHHLNILEVGSWMGASTLSWAQGLRDYNHATGTISCIDAWQPFFNRATHQKDVYTQMELALSSDIAYQLYLHNIRTLPSTITCHHFRGKSENILPLLREKYFDIIFIDSDHTYQAVLNDIRCSFPLIKNKGILCGDDLNLQLSQVDHEYALKHADQDFIPDPKTKRNYHPGVTLAVNELLGNVSSWGGFWAMQKYNDSWQKISLKGMPIHYPNHFPEDALKKAEAHLKDIEIY
ncbi:MAG: hypothetical protein A3F42_06720 [Gammaproteobacteria bacterium RIFCSPHIGHO2_12_FULL_37_34]|nr:MAG: hypothetical protein A3F42_06720 [Gammaproteobacteria bacterium RIFCSPHIGHO2_12_FULL_37_34]